jgi:hypothetical protein
MSCYVITWCGMFGVGPSDYLWPHLVFVMGQRGLEAAPVRSVRRCTDDHRLIGRVSMRSNFAALKISSCNSKVGPNVTRRFSHPECRAKMWNCSYGLVLRGDLWNIYVCIVAQEDNCFYGTRNFVTMYPKARAVIAQSVWRWATGWTIGVLGFDSRRWLGIFLSTTASRMALGPTQPLIQWVPEALSLGVERPWCEADHPSPSSAEVKECVKLYLHSPHTPNGVILCLKRHRDNFTVTFTFMFPKACHWNLSLTRWVLSTCSQFSSTPPLPHKIPETIKICSDRVYLRDKSLVTNEKHICQRHCWNASL